jgi:hypothetical protein
MTGKFHRLTVILSFLCFSFTAQTPQTIYPPDGIYATFSSFRNGKPDLVKSQLVKSVSEDEYTLRQWVNSEKLLYLDQNQQKQPYDPANFWGFFEKGVLYIYLGNKFHKVHTLGQISYFLESYPVIKGNMAPVVTEARSTSAYRFLDMETGDILDYTAENLLDLLEPDELLYLEYKSIISQKERKKKMFIYMEKYNSSHPLERQAL